MSLVERAQPCQLVLISAPKRSAVGALESHR